MNFYQLLTLMLLLAYTLSYAVVCLRHYRPRRWLQGGQSVNVTLGLALIGLSLAVNNAGFQNAAWRPGAVYSPTVKLKRATHYNRHSVRHWQALNAQMRQSGLVWRSAKAASSQRALVVGDTYHPVQLCRRQVVGRAHHYAAGLLVNQRCHLLLPKQATLSSGYKVLTGRASALIWRKGAPPRLHRALDRQAAQWPLVLGLYTRHGGARVIDFVYVCQARQQGRLVTGLSDGRFCYTLESDQFVSQGYAQRYLAFKQGK